MPQIRKVKKLLFSPEQMFDLVADVARYPEFLPWCGGAKLIKRDEVEIIGSITAQKGGFHKSFTTRNRYQYPDWMDIALLNGPFKRLNGRWEFRRLPNNECEVYYEMNFEVSFLLAPILEPLMAHMSNTMVDSFAKRAQDIYGTDSH